MSIGNLETEADLRAFLQHELDGSNVATLARQLQGLFGKARPSWGLISSTGTIFAGSGDYTVAHPGTGSYTITWTPAKAGGSYAVLVNPASAAAVNAQPVTIAAATVAIVAYAPATSAAVDTAWSFIAIDAQ